MIQLSEEITPLRCRDDSTRVAVGDCICVEQPDGTNDWRKLGALGVTGEMCELDDLNTSSFVQSGKRLHDSTLQLPGIDIPGAISKIHIDATDAFTVAAVIGTAYAVRRVIKRMRE